MVEMELQKVISLAADGDEASRIESDLDGVAVVDDAEGRRRVGELDGGKVGGFRLADVDGRLVRSRLALGVVRVEVRPVRRAVLAVVGPRMSAFGMLLAERGPCAANHREQDRERVRHADRHDCLPWAADCSPRTGPLESWTMAQSGLQGRWTFIATYFAVGQNFGSFAVGLSPGCLHDPPVTGWTGRAGFTSACFVMVDALSPRGPDYEMREIQGYSIAP